jgi:hypothetical protein
LFPSRTTSEHSFTDFTGIFRNIAVTLQRYPSPFNNQQSSPIALYLRQRFDQLTAAAAQDPYDSP